MRNTILGVIRQRGKIVRGTQISSRNGERAVGAGWWYGSLYIFLFRMLHSPTVVVVGGAKTPNAGFGSPEFYVFLFGQFAQLQKVVVVTVKHFLIITFCFYPKSIFYSRFLWLPGPHTSRKPGVVLLLQQQIHGF